MAHPMLIGFILGMLVHFWLRIVINNVRQLQKAKKSKDTVVIEMTKKDYMRFMSMPKKKNPIGFAASLQPEGEDKEETA